MSNTPNSSRPPYIWTSAQRYFGPKVRAVAAGPGLTFSGSLPFLAPLIRQQPQSLPEKWRTAIAIDHATKSTPVLQGHLTQHRFAHAAQHDIGSLHGIETKLKAMAPKAEDAFWRTLHQVVPGGLLIDVLEQGFGNTPGDVDKSFVAGAANSVGSAIRGVGAFDDSATRSAARLVAGEKAVAGYQSRRARGDFAPLQGDLFTAMASPLFAGAAALKKGVRDTPLTHGSETVGNIAPGLAVSVRNPQAGAAFFAAQGADSQNQAAIRAGKEGTWQADLGVLGNVGAQGLLGLIPGVGAERYLPKFASPAANAAVQSGARTTAGAASGASSNIAGNLIEKWTVNPDKDIWEGTPESAIWGGALGAAHAVKEDLPGRRPAPAAKAPAPEAPHPDHPEPAPALTPPAAPHPVAKAAEAIENHHALTDVVRTARTSTLRRDDPARFQAFAAKITVAAETPPIQVAPEVLDAVLATPEGQRVQAAVPDLPERVVAAREAGADVSMPAHEYVTHVGPELHDRIAGDVRVGPDAMTPAEAVADHETRVAALHNASAEAKARAPDPEAFRQSRHALTDVIRQHYDRKTVGRLPPDQRARAAELAGHAFAVEAANRSVDPMEVYRSTNETWQGEHGTNSSQVGAPSGSNDVDGANGSIVQIVPVGMRQAEFTSTGSETNSNTEVANISSGGETPPALQKGNSDAAKDSRSSEGTSGETPATATGKSMHAKIAEARRKSGDFDLINETLADIAGAAVQVPKRVDLSTGNAMDDRIQIARPDAVRFKNDLILDDKPLGRPIAKDRQEIIRFISAYKLSRGKMPRTIAIQRYDPKTGELILTELFEPNDFIQKMKQ